MIKGIYRGRDLLDVSSFSATWATNRTDVKTALNALPVGTYTLSCTFTLTSRNDTSDASVYGITGNVSAGSGFSTRDRWNDKTVGDSIQYSVTFQVTEQNQNNFSAVYFYGCGISNVGATGAATVDNIVLNGDIPKDITRIAMKGKNLFDKSAAENGKWLNVNTGVEENTTTTYWLSDYIPVVSGQPYTFANPNSSRRWFYNASKTPVEKIDASATYTPASNGFVRFTITNEVVDSFMLNLGSTALPYEPYGMQPGWEVRDQQGTILWGADKTLTGTDSISFKGYGLPLKGIEIEANMEQAATQVYTIEGTSSIDYQSDGTAIALQIVGNETQTGTPTPTVPIQPEECGEKTGNLFDAATTVHNYYISDDDGDVKYAVNNDASDFIEIEPDTAYYITPLSAGNWGAWYDDNKQFISGINGYREKTSPANAKYVRLTVNRNNNNTDFQNSFMVVKGTTAPETFIPYGYKIPFSNGNTTYNVYLKEPLRKIGDYADSVSSDGTVVRRVKKMVLTGSELWNQLWDSMEIVLDDAIGKTGTTTIMCSHYAGKNTVTSGQGRPSTYGDNCIFLRASSPTQMLIYDIVNGTDRAGFNAYLAQQYQNGTPVTVWYVLANEITEQTTFPTVTPTQGANTLSVSTTLAPSKTRITATSGVWPGNPIQPEEFGEPTANLTNQETVETANANTALGSQTGLVQAIKSLTPGITYTLSWAFTSTSTTGVRNQVRLYNGSQSMNVYIDNGSSFSLTSEQITNVNQIVAYFGNAGGSMSNFMLNLGSTALPYEPYGKYKIPITNSGQTYNIFLNEPLRKIGDYGDTVSSDGTVVRRIRKLVFTGNESNWKISSSWKHTNTSVFYKDYTSILKKNDTGIFLVSSHFESTSRNGLYNDDFDCCAITGSGGITFRISDSIATTLDGWIAFLTGQYSSGTPVCAWHIESTPTTESITAPEIATTQGTNTLAIGTTLAPSKTTITGHIKPITT